MKLVRLYSNHPEIFSPIQFNDGFNVILAEIRLNENEKTVHNLGKSTVARLIDFCLLKGKSANFFLYKHADIFGDFVFYLEFKLGDGVFYTIARSVASSKVSLLSSTEDISDATELQPNRWQHTGLGIKAAKRLLDGILNFSVISPHNFRNIMGYVLREQSDYGDVFQLSKFRGKHKEWKPFLAHLLGFDAELTVDLYRQIEEEERLDSEIRHLQAEGGAGQDVDISKLDGIVAIRSGELMALQSTLDSFDFSRADMEATDELIEDIEEKIAAANEENYRLNQLKKKLSQSLEDEAILFSPNQVEELFSEAGVAFPGQLKKDFQQLIEFNRAISTERRAYLLKELEDIDNRLEVLEPELENLQTQRAGLFSFLEHSDTIDKYKEISNKAVELQADIKSLDRQREALSRIVELRQETRRIQEHKNHLQTAIENDVQIQSGAESSRYRTIQKYFDEIVHHVLDEHAILSVDVKSTGALEFSAEIVDSTGAQTSAGRGFTFGKLLCIAFDLAVLRSYAGEDFPKFTFHDGVFESLEPRAKRRLIAILREYAEMGLQPVITTLDSDLPDSVSSSNDAVQADDVICTLHDDGQEGRLFRVRSF